MMITSDEYEFIRTHGLAGDALNAAKAGLLGLFMDDIRRRMPKPRRPANHRKLRAHSVRHRKPQDVVVNRPSGKQS